VGGGSVILEGEHYRIPCIAFEESPVYRRAWDVCRSDAAFGPAPHERYDPAGDAAVRVELVKLKNVLAAGFGLTLGLWLLSGYQFAQRIDQLERQATAITRRYSDAQDRLASARQQVLLGSVFVRDALLDPDPRATAGYRRQFDAAHHSAEASLAGYVPMRDTPLDRARVLQLREQIDEFRAVMVGVLEAEGSTPPADALALLRSRIMPKRDLVVSFSEEFQSLNRRGYIQQQQASATIYADAQRRVWRQFGFALLVGVGIGIFAALYAGRLEDRLRAQRDREAEHKEDLRRLSARVIQAQEDERRIIGRELHDELGQVLTAIKVELAGAQRAIEANGGSPQLLANARGIADGGLHTVRDLSRLLHPSVLDDLGLAAALEWQLREFQSRHGVTTTLRHRELSPRMPRDVELAVYRVIQEALTNVARHANATHVSVDVWRAPDALVFRVKDNGCGFASDSQPPRSLGLFGMRERIASVDGAVTIDSDVGAGTRVTIWVPMTPDGDDEESLGLAGLPQPVVGHG
jgi:signal transduction histidine kinase